MEKILLILKCLSIILQYYKRKTNKELWKVYIIISHKSFFIVINLKTEREYNHLFDSEKELNPVDGLIADFYDVELEDNYTFD